MLTVTRDIALLEDELQFAFLRASGPGGQNVNKVSTAVELRFDVAASSLTQEVKERLGRIAGSKMGADGVLVIDSREYRLQSQNRTAARARLAALIQLALVRPRQRRATKPKAGAREERLAGKKHRGEIKKQRGRRRGADD
jgi:ribosome-associated protein